MVWATGTTDQQISEDAMLTVLTLAAATALGPGTEPLPARAERHLQALAAVDTELLGAFRAPSQGVPAATGRCSTGNGWASPASTSRDRSRAA
ncbi:hypothetical protein [Streptomyces sp. NPDC059949]|uniref:hypothetical protein n=1 Tax=Streptomyces sp. NPDC059949 TaxID=3347013 RepID=UPI0036668AFB